MVTLERGSTSSQFDYIEAIRPNVSDIGVTHHFWRADELTNVAGPKCHHDLLLAGYDSSVLVDVALAKTSMTRRFL